MPCATGSVLAVRAWRLTTLRAARSSVVRTTTPSTMETTQPVEPGGIDGDGALVFARHPPSTALGDPYDRQQDEAHGEREPGDRGHEVDDAER